MAEDDMADAYFDDDDDDFDWLYVEDSCPLAVSHALGKVQACVVTGSRLRQKCPPYIASSRSL